MQHRLDMPEKSSELGAITALDVAKTPDNLQVRQLTAALWLERCLNQIQRRINDCLVGAATYKQGITPEARIFQAVVKELGIALGSSSVGIALANTGTSEHSSAPEIAFEICYVAHIQQSQLELTNPPVVILATGKTFELRMGCVFTLEELQQLQTQKPQSAWPLHDDQDLLCWLIAASFPPPADSESLEALRNNFRPQLMERTSRQCAVALGQLRQMQTASLKYQQLEARNQELLRANQLKSEFLANTSHEIRTPLSSILGFTHLLKAQGYCPSNLRHQEYLDIILSSGQHLLALINDILDLSKIEANQLEVEWAPVDVSQLCRSVVALVKEKANDKGLQLRVDLDPHATTLVADSLRLKQMLFNLLSNALKFTSQGVVGLQVKHRGVFIDFTVWDTGTGIPKEQQSQLFQPYSQLANTVTSRQEGTGLGLALTQKLAELQGGWIEFQSELNQGSKFTIVLPLTPAVGVNQKQSESTEKKVAPTPYVPLSAPQQIKSPILLVEDHPPNATLIMTYLNKFGGYQVIWAKDAGQMWQVLKETQPLLILMDVHLPDVNGLTLIGQLQAQEQYRRIPVIVQTAMAMKGDKEACLATGAVDYISKPIDLNLLLAKVTKVSMPSC